jgi:DNA-binding NarL/FixJ family response regulator
MSFEQPPPDLAKLIAAWEEFENGEQSPGKVLANLKTAGLPEVLAQLARGHSNRQIAGALFISEKTVARHLSNIFAKLGVATRAAAAAYAVEHDLGVGASG